jgi:hypothetical protein
MARIHTGSGCWLNVLRSYLLFSVGANFIWEIAHLPLYTIGQTGSLDELAFAVAHCTASDLLIAGGALMGSLLLFGTRGWPNERFLLIASLTVLVGIGYTLFSERRNTERGSWTYSTLMPVVPMTGTGLTPLGQWIVIPVAAFWWARRRQRTSSDAVGSDASSVPSSLRAREGQHQERSINGQ